MDMPRPCPSEMHQFELADPVGLGGLEEYNLDLDIPSSDKCGYVSYLHINDYVEFSFYNCLDVTLGLFGIICEKSRNRN